MLYWSRYHVIARPCISAVCFLMLTGCNALQPLFSPRPTTKDQAVNLVSNAIDGSNLWSPIILVGFLALLAGVVNLVLLRGSAKLFIIGVLLALTPPIVEIVFETISPLITIFVALAGLALLGWVMGRWLGRKDIIRRANARADYIAGNGKNTLTKGQTADGLSHLGVHDFEADYPIGK